jgi:hypothetical protein
VGDQNMSLHLAVIAGRLDSAVAKLPAEYVSCPSRHDDDNELLRRPKTTELDESDIRNSH